MIFICRETPFFSLEPEDCEGSKYNMLRQRTTKNYFTTSHGTVIEFHEFRNGDIVKVQQNSFFDATFYLNTSKCRHSPDWFRVKVVYYQDDFFVEVCNVIYTHICDITDMSSFCFCKNDSKKSVRLYRKFKVSGNVSYIWKLSESSSDHVQKKAQITFDVASNSQKEETTAALQKAGSSYKEETTTVIQPTDARAS